MNLRTIFFSFLAIATLIACEAKVENETGVEGGASFENSNSSSTTTTTTSSKGSSTTFSSNSSSSKVAVGGSAKSSSSVTVKTGITPRIKLIIGNDHHHVDVYDFNKDGKLEYYTMDLQKPTRDPVFYAFDYLCKGSLRRYVRNVKVTKIAVNEQERFIYFEGTPVFEDKAAEAEFLKILHKTAQAYTEQYRFYMNGREFR